MTEPPTTIDEYISTFPADVQPTLREVRRRLRDVLPGVEETINYGIPTFALDGRSVVYFAGWTHHISVYPVPAGDAEELARALREALGLSPLERSDVGVSARRRVLANFTTNSMQRSTLTLYDKLLGTALAGQFSAGNAHNHSLTQ